MAVRQLRADCILPRAECTAIALGREMARVRRVQAVRRVVGLSGAAAAGTKPGGWPARAGIRIHNRTMPDFDSPGLAHSGRLDFANRSFEKMIPHSMMETRRICGAKGSAHNFTLRLQ